jgi:hypothetical protein
VRKITRDRNREERVRKCRFWFRKIEWRNERPGET